MPSKQAAMVGFALAALLSGCATGKAAGGDGTRAAEPEDSSAVAAVRAAAIPLTGGSGDYDALLEMVGDARVVLLGEATHGTQEFYRARAEITRRLILEKGFDAVAVEADWPEALPVNRYVRGAGGGDARQALSGFTDFPVWMWRNTDVVQLVEWLRSHNAALPAEARVGFYGIDYQVLGPAARTVVDFLAPLDRAAADRARRRYRCFHPHADEPVAWAQAVELRQSRACTREVADQLRDLERQRSTLRAGGGAEEYFGAAQSARMLVGAEEYFRSMLIRGVSTWNLRDRYMARVLDQLATHLDRPDDPARIVVWAHNSHVGDARATHMAHQGELSLGQLARERWGRQAVLVGFTTYTGTVVAASDWGGAAERKQVREALPGSVEALFHRTGLPAFLLPLGDRGPQALRQPRLERAIGVIYLPQTERLSHYFDARPAAQFDAVIHFDRTRAVEPLEPLRAGLGRRASPNPTRS